MTVFADSSAVLKLYVDETDHQPVRALPTPFALAGITRVEVTSALWRKHRMDDIDAGQAADLVMAFQADLGADSERFLVSATPRHLLADAARLCGTHRLRALDAVQLASANRVRSAAPRCDSFLTFDRRLRSAASAEGFVVDLDRMGHRSE